MKSQHRTAEESRDFIPAYTAQPQPLSKPDWARITLPHPVLRLAALASAKWSLMKASTWLGWGAGLSRDVWRYVP